MLRKTTINSLLLLLLSVSFLHGQAGDDDRKLYIDRYSALAIHEMERTGVPASIKLGQAILESRWGTSTLARSANNHFGIKCGGRWTGETYYREDDDYVLGKLVPSCFRSYPSVEASYVAHSNFLTQNSRYRDLFSIKKTNYKAWAKGLKSAGYATAKNYHKSLIRIIEDLELHRYDQMKGTEVIYIPEDPVLVDNNGPSKSNKVPVNPPGVDGPEKAKPVKAVQVLLNNDVKFVVSQEGETLESLAKKLKIPANWLLAYNEHIEAASQVLEGGEWIYIQAKRKNYRGRQKWHEIISGENMFGLSQRYGISLKGLYERNQMIEGTEPAVGARVKLRGGKVKTTPVLQMVRGVGSTQNRVPGSPVVPENAQERPLTPPIYLDLRLKESDHSLPEKEQSTMSSGTVYYKVVLGDSIEQIANRYATSVQKIRDWNGIGEKELLKPGALLRVQ